MKTLKKDRFHTVPSDVYSGACMTDKKEDSPQISQAYAGSYQADSMLSVKHLTTSENLIVLSIRIWVDALQAKKNPFVEIQNGFLCAGIPKASFAFDELMLVTATTATRSLDVRYLHCEGLGAAELDFISLIAFAQNGKLEWTFQRLSGWLPPTAARRSLAEIIKIADYMEGVGLFIRLRSEFINCDLSTFRNGNCKSPNVGEHSTVQ